MSLDSGQTEWLLVIREMVTVCPLKTEAAPGEGVQVQRQGGGDGGLRGGAGGVVRVRVQGGGQVVHTEGLSQLGVHQGKSRHLFSGSILDKIC